MFNIASVVLLIIIILLIFHWQVGLDLFLELFEIFDVSFNPSKIWLYSISLILGVTLLLLLVNYLVVGKLRYEFYQSKLVVYENTFLVFVNPKEIPYPNIVKISYNNDGIFNKVFNSGSIVLELSGMKEDKFKLELIDNIEQNVKYLQSLIQQFKNIQQAQFTENYKINKILDRY